MESLSYESQNTLLFERVMGASVESLPWSVGAGGAIHLEMATIYGRDLQTTARGANPACHKILLSGLQQLKSSRHVDSKHIISV